MAFTNIFGGTAVKPSQPSYEALTISANITLSWPLESAEGVPYVASQIDVTATTGGLQIAMPNAMQGALGQVAVITNVGSNSVTFTDNTGVPIVTIAASQSWLLSLSSNLTIAGTWRAIQFGATTSNAQASTLADNETTFANGTVLNVGVPTNLLTVNTNITVGYRGSMNVWKGTAPGTLQLDTVTNLGADWYCYFANNSLYTVVITTSGGNTINGQASLTLFPGNGTIVVCSASGFNSTLIPAPPVQPISAFTAIGDRASGSAPVAITTTAASPTGALIVVGVSDFSTAGESGVTLVDSASNTYTLVAEVSPNNVAADGFVKLYFSYNSTALPLGGTITYTNASQNAFIVMGAAYATGVLKSSTPLDQFATAYGSSTTPSVTCAATVANELFVGFASNGNFSGSSTFVQAAGWSTPLTSAGEGLVIGGNLKNFTATTETYNPTIAVSHVWAAIIASFKPGF